MAFSRGPLGIEIGIQFLIVSGKVSSNVGGFLDLDSASVLYHS